MTQIVGSKTTTSPSILCLRLSLDPLNWSSTYRYYIAILVSAAIFSSNDLDVVITGLAARAAEVMAPLTISDILQHECGTIYTIYTFAPSARAAAVSLSLASYYGWRPL